MATDEDRRDERLGIKQNERAAAVEAAAFALRKPDGTPPARTEVEALADYILRGKRARP